MIELLIIVIVAVILVVYFYNKTYYLDIPPRHTYSAEYFRGLNYLLNNEDDKSFKDIY